ncbi:hypothetical protein GCK32_021899, partial [Trichostrongylus colubriformis]
IHFDSIYVKPISPVLNGKLSYAVAVVTVHEEKDKQTNFSLTMTGLTNENGHLLCNLRTSEDGRHVEPSYTLTFKLRPTFLSFVKLTAE